MPTPELAKKKWKAKVKGSAWKTGVTGKESDYCKGIADFLGTTTCNPAVSGNYKAGVDTVSAADFDAAVSGKEDKWFKRYKEKMGG
jgi:hypothetical protein